MRRFFLSFLVLAACAGTRARDAAISPLAKFFTPIGDLATRGATAAAAAHEINVGQLEQLERDVASTQAALDGGDRSVIRTVPWLAIEPFAQRGVQAKVDAHQLTEGTAGSLRESIRVFGLLLQQVQQ